MLSLYCRYCYLVLAVATESVPGAFVVDDAVRSVIVVTTYRHANSGIPNVCVSSLAGPDGPSADGYGAATRTVRHGLQPTTKEQSWSSDDCVDSCVPSLPERRCHVTQQRPHWSGACPLTVTTLSSWHVMLVPFDPRSGNAIGNAFPIGVVAAHLANPSTSQPNSRDLSYRRKSTSSLLVRTTCE